jgi:hypothetical protein
VKQRYGEEQIIAILHDARGDPEWASSALTAALWARTKAALSLSDTLPAPAAILPHHTASLLYSKKGETRGEYCR